MKKYFNKFIFFYIFFISASVIIFFSFLSKNNNNLKSSHVIDLQAEAKDIQKICEKTPTPEKKVDGWYKQTCYSKAMKNVAFEKGVSHAYKVLEALQQIDKEATNCHFIAHGIGWGSYEKNPSGWRKLINESPSTCGYGEQMGIIERYIYTLPKGTLDQSSMPELCGPTPKADCNHGVGHIALVLTKNNLEKATKLCESLDTNQKSTCFDGMMMERFIGENLRDHKIIPQSTSNWSTKIPEDKTFCMQFTGDILLACWQEIAHPAYYYFNRNIRKIFKFCGEAPIPDATLKCMRHSLTLIAGGLNYNLDALKDTCTTGKNINLSFEKDCYRNLVAIRLNFTPLEKAGDVIPFCTNAPSVYQSMCFNTIGPTLKSLHTPFTKIQSFCEKAPREYRKTCLGQIENSN